MQEEFTGHVTENEIGFAILQALANPSKGGVQITELIKPLPDYLNLSADDHSVSKTRPNEEAWKQRVRNIISHRESGGNITA